MARRMIWTYCGIFFLAGSIILFEIAMTRVFAIMMWHHFSYMVISIALVGFGAAGSILTARREVLRKDPPFGALALYSMGYGIACIAAFCATTRVPIDSLEIWADKTNFLALLLIYTILAVPLILGGMAVGMALTRFSERVNKLYFVDLVGSAAGAAVSTVVLAAWGNTATVMTAAAAGLFGSFLFSFAAPTSRRILTGASLVLGIVVVVACSGGFPRAAAKPLIPAIQWHIPFAPGKEMAGVIPEIRIPSATAEVSVAAPEVRQPLIGGDFGARDATVLSLRLVTQDGTAPTVLFENAANIAGFPFLDDTQAGTAYVAREASGRTKPEVLVIGVGGGVDVMIALAHDAKRVTAVEINSAMIEMTTEVYRDYTGGLMVPGGHPLADRIDLVHDEGRSYVRRGDQRFDIIQMSGVDTFTALSMGAYTLSESYLYTVDAVKEFYGRLNENGYVNYSRIMLQRGAKPRETIRLANIALTALEELGVDDPASHLCVFQGFDWASTMIKRGRFTPEEMKALHQFAADEGFFGVVFDPLHDPATPLLPARGPSAALPHVKAWGVGMMNGLVRTQLLPAADKTATEAEVAMLANGIWSAVIETTKDNPVGADAELTKVAAWFPEPARRRVRESIDGVLRGLGNLSGGMIAGFDKTRADFSVLLRGDAATRRKFIDGYEYDLSACRDDWPFFFNYYKYSGLFQKHEKSIMSWYTPDFPVGHMVLLGSLAQILLLAVVLIVLPIRRLARAGMATPGKLRYLAYFSALGLGFMFIEIVMMQKMVIFLGHPTYALSVVLTALLASTGLGSLVSERLPIRPRSALVILGAILAVATFALIAANTLLPLALGRPLATRIALVACVLAPLGFVLGMAFPTGIRVVKQRSPGLLPWCWAINGVTSVFASLFCIVLALEIGFSAVMMIAAGIYLLGFLAILPEFRGAETPAPVSA